MMKIFDEIKFNIKIAAVLVAIGICNGMVQTSSFFALGLNGFMRLSGNDMYEHYEKLVTNNVMILLVGFYIGILLSWNFPALKTKILEFSGISIRIFNFFDYIAAILLGFAISITIYYAYSALIYIVFYKNLGYLLRFFSFYQIFCLFIGTFGIIHGIIFQLFLQNKILGFDNDFSAFQYLCILLLCITSVFFSGYCSSFMIFKMI